MNAFQPLTPRRFRIYNSAYSDPWYVPHEPWVLLEHGHEEDDVLRSATSHTELVDFLDSHFRFERLWEKVHGPTNTRQPSNPLLNSQGHHNPDQEQS